MNCPRDDSPLFSTEKNGVNGRECPTCGGLWLDPQNLRKSIAQSELPDSLPPKREVDQEEAIQCPVDPSERLIRKRFFGIQIDICPQQHGVWFDADELRPLLEKWTNAMRNTQFQIDWNGVLHKETGPDLIMKLVVGKEEAQPQDWITESKEFATFAGGGLVEISKYLWGAFVWHLQQVRRHLDDDRDRHITHIDSDD